MLVEGIPRLTPDNFLLYAIKVYNNPHCLSMYEFQEDLKRIKYINRLFKRYDREKDLKERLILNHLIILYNMFPPEHATRILFFKIDSKYWPLLKTFLEYLYYMPDTITGFTPNVIYSSDIPINIEVANILRKL